MLTPDILYPISHSRLNAFKRSPLHLIHYLTQPKEQTPAMAFGSAFHMALLQPDQFQYEYAVAPDVDRRSKEGKLEWDAFVYNNEHKTVISRNDMEKIDRMCVSILSSGQASDLILSATEKELLTEWVNEDTLLPMRGIIDGVGSNFMFDLKTCTDATPHKFQREAWNMDYHRQAAIYLDSLQGESKEFYFIAIEKEAPYGVSVHRCDQSVIDKGRTQFLKLLEEYRNWVSLGCPASGYDYWHYTGIHDFETPSYIKNNE